MRQSPTFNNARIRQLKEGNPTAKSVTQENVYYHGGQAAKKLCIVWEATGCKWAFLYSEIVDLKLEHDGELNCLTLYFMRRTVILKGYNLDVLFDSFMIDEMQILAVKDERYTVFSQDREPYITEAMVE